MRLSPLDPLMFSMRQVTALAHDIARRYAEAALLLADAAGMAHLGLRKREANNQGLPP